NQAIPSVCTSAKQPLWSSELFLRSFPKEQTLPCSTRCERCHLAAMDISPINMGCIGSSKGRNKGSMSAYQTDPRVDEYINSLPTWQQDIARQVRDLVHAADPDVTETIKRTDRPYFTLDGNICALLGAKDHLNIFIYDPKVPDPEGIINQGHGNLTARTIQVRQGETINKRALLHLFQAIIAHNRVGGWRKLKGSH